MGGRFNIAGAQIKEAKSVSTSMEIFAAIYLASSKACALKEVGFPKNSTVYKIKAKRKLKLLNLEKTAESLQYPSLKSLIDASPIDAAWEMQNIPLHSQLISAYFFQDDDTLDGIMYPSTKLKGGTNYAIFERIGTELKNSLKII